MWNEPELSMAGLPSAYLELYASTARVLERAARDTQVKIEVGGPAPVVGVTYLVENLVAYVDEHDLPLDFVSWHWYPDIACPGFKPPCPGMRTQAIGEQARVLRAALDKHPRVHAKLWVTEWNTDFTASTDTAVTPYGAAFVAGVLDAMQSAGVDRSAIFLSSGSDTLSLIQNDGTSPGPEYRTFAYWRAMAKTRCAVTRGEHVQPRSAGPCEELSAGCPSCHGLAGAITLRD